MEEGNLRLHVCYLTGTYEIQVLPYRCLKWRTVKEGFTTIEEAYGKIGGVLQKWGRDGDSFRVRIIQVDVDGWYGSTTVFECKVIK